jgi:GH15 family glucan-1,4-alpha-glucosidase
VHLESDQQPLYSWAVREVAKQVEEDDKEEFLRSTWPAVRNTLRFTIDSIGSDNLLRPTPDIDEWPDSVRQSLWTNTWAYRGLHAGAEIASILGQQDGDFAAAADRVGSGIKSTFFDKTPFQTVRDTKGLHRDLYAYDSVALFPTRWAFKYGEAGRIRKSLVELAEDEPTWIPGAFMLATTLYQADEKEAAEALFQRTVPMQTVAGHLIERHTEARDFDFASPLAWSHAAFVLAVQARNDWIVAEREGSQHRIR